MIETCNCYIFGTFFFREWRGEICGSGKVAFYGARWRSDGGPGRRWV
jgi:hypothetical protein